MNMQSWVNPKINRTDWGAGEWDGEPDKLQWTDAATGLPCLAVRSASVGSWCAYVGVPRGHPLHRIDHCNLPYLEVHGGVTFADACQPGAIEGSICHVPAPGEADDTWWIGFDAAHAWDYAPGMEATLRRIAPRRAPGPGQLPAERDVYRTLSYVRAQCGRLAMQLEALQA